MDVYADPFISGEGEIPNGAMASRAVDSRGLRLHRAERTEDRATRRFADDFLCAFQFKEDAEAFERNLKDRLEGFGLEIAPEKTRRMEYGPYAEQNAKRRREKTPKFTFLGLTHYCGRTRHGHFKVKRHTSIKKFKAKLREYSEWIRKARGVMPTGDLMRRAKARIQGHLNYYAITDNYELCEKYYYWFTRITFK